MKAVIAALIIALILSVPVGTVSASPARAAPGKAAPEKETPVPVRVDREGRLVRNGKPFFVLGWYSDGSLERLRRIGRSPFNTVLDYGLTARPIEVTQRYLEEAEKLGVAVIMCVNDVYPSAKHRKRLGAWEGNAAILKGVVESFRRNPAVLAWYNNDELSFDLAEEARAYYRTIKELDPAHPQLMVHYKRGGLKAFAGAADIFGLDHYPIPKSGPASVAEALDRACSEVTPPTPVWAVLQDFAWYQHRKPEKPVVPGDLDTPRARIPTPREWRDGRAPTREEVRAMTYLAVIHGAKGILYWCLYNLDYLPDRAERWRDACAIAREIRELEPVLLSPGGKRISWSDPSVHALRKEYGGAAYVIAANASREPLRVELKGLPAGASHVPVLFENRKARVKKGALTDFFAPLERHVYRIAGTSAIK